jgi:nucleoside-diphosphate-sugar epimerase/5'-deoxynucleotidase YfbR-like HD superfamily hydrolase
VSRSVLIIGGTRNLGYYTALQFFRSGDSVTIVNRGVTPHDLPPEIRQVRADRTSPEELRAALRGFTFDLVVDTALYTGAEAESIVEILDGRVGRYVFISTGQVYLVRTGLQRPFREEDYDGPVMPPPAPGSSDYEQWAYGAHKRDAEDVFTRAWLERRFPVTSLRLPMVNSPRDHHERLLNYIVRIRDGGPVLVPAGQHPPLRHVWVHDVVQAIARLAESSEGIGRAFNLSQNETLTIDDFLARLARHLGRECRIVRIPREVLEEQGLLPSCSPFSGRWMSELDNARSVRERQQRYTPVDEVIRDVIASAASTFQDRSGGEPDRPAGYAQRPRELALAAAERGPLHAFAHEPRLAKQVAFLVEIDRLKHVLRRTPIADNSRQENSAEHTWHLMLCAMVLKEYAPAGVDLSRTLQLLAVHDLVEIDAGDTFAYDPAGNVGKHERETRAANRLFGLLPPDQAADIHALWTEFEAMATDEARLANAVDRFQALVLNAASGGGSWRRGRVNRSQVEARMAPVVASMPALAPFLAAVIDAFHEAGVIG